MKPLSIYIHIPFCDHKCIYCDFYSIINLEKRKEYLSALKTEITEYALKFAKNHSVFSIFFGGGTPSYLEVDEIGGLIEHIMGHFQVSETVEITLETNPGTVNREKLMGFRKTGVNRLSVGIQSFDESDLKFLTRIHNKQQAIETIESSSAAGFENLSLDLIFNLPGQTKTKWLENLETACSLPICHISPYSLRLERGTILNKMVIEGKVELQGEDYDADLYETTIEYLGGRGFHQYEVSNFAKQGYECRHNLAYWRYGDYLGFGTSAHSFLNGERWWNFSALTFYLESVNTRRHARSGGEKLTGKDQLDEYVMLALRSSGLDLERLKAKFGHNWEEQNMQKLEQLISAGFLRMERDNFIKFTAEGYAVCDEILAGFS